MNDPQLPIRMTRDEILAAIHNAEKHNGFIGIQGYKSESGRIANVIVRPLGKDGYHRLIRKSIAAAADLSRPEWVDEEVWDKALGEQVASWSKTLNGGHKQTNRFEQEALGFYSHGGEDGDKAIYVKNIVVISKTIVQEGTYPIVNSADKTKAKKYIRDHTPIKNYAACYRLKDGNFKTIAFSGQRIETFNDIDLITPRLK